MLALKLSRLRLLPLLRPFSQTSLPPFKEVSDLISYANTNKSTLSPQQVYEMFNTLFSLKHYNDLRKLPSIRVFFTDTQLRRFIDSLDPHKAVRIARRLFQLEIVSPSEWMPLLKLLDGKLTELSEDDLYELMLYSAQYMERSPADPFWTKLFVELARKSDQYKPSEMVEILLRAAKMKVSEAEFWKKIEASINSVATSMSKEDATNIVDCYDDNNIEAGGILPAVRRMLVNKLD